LYPLDPSTDAVTPGGRKFEVRSGGDREAFTVDDAEGTGVVLAAWSETQFNFDEFVNGDHWNLDALGAQHGDAGDADAEQNDDSDPDAQPDARQTAPDAALVAVVQRMAGENQFAYDVATYVVQSGTAYNDGYRDPRPEAESQDGESDDRESNDRGSYDRGSYGPNYGSPYYGPYSGLSLGFGSPWRYGRVGIGTYCDGFYWSTWGCGPFYDPFYYPVVYRPFVFRSYGYRPYGYRSYGFGGSHGRPYVGRPYGFRNGTSLGYARPRARAPLGGSFSSGSSRGYVGGRTGTRVSGSSRTFDRGSARARPSYAPRGERTGSRAPSARSAPSSRGSSRGAVGSAAPRSSGPGYSRGSGGSSRSGGGSARSGGGSSRSGGGSARSGGGGGGRRDGGGGGGGRRH
jgi:hypothetical protein